MTDEDDFDAAAAAARATGEPTPSTGEAPDVDGDASEDGGDGGGNRPAAEANTQTVREMVLSTEPSKPLSAVESPWDPDAGGVTRVFRGIMKATGIDGLPAIGDVLIGTIEAMKNYDVAGGEDGDTADVVDGDQGAIV